MARPLLVWRFGRTLARGERVLAQAIQRCQEAGEVKLSGATTFQLYDTFGFPLELTVELADQAGMVVDEAGFAAAYTEHQERSRVGAAGRFAGGLVERHRMTTALHTATHLLHAALRQLIGSGIEQRKGCLGSRSEAGCRFVERILSVRATCVQQQRSLFALVTEAIEAAWAGLPAPLLMSGPATA